MIQSAAGDSSYLGSMGAIMFNMASRNLRKWSFANCCHMGVQEWRENARTVFLENLSFSPDVIPLDPRVMKTQKFPGYVQEWVDFAGTKDYRITGVLLIPDKGKPPFPAVVALHDHGGFFYYGKEKLIRQDVELPRLQSFKEQYYDGKSWASELVRRGYVVIVIDCLGWGIRNIDTPSFEDPFSHRLAVEEEEDVDEINTRMAVASGCLDLHLAYAGLSWAGIVSWDDRRSVDYLISRPEVDPQRIACVGLSGGGFRSTYLFGADPRIACAGVVGWTTCLAYQLIQNLPYHLGLFSAPCVYKKMDHPDIAALGAPKPLFVQQCSRDCLFHMEAMVRSCEDIRRVYESCDAREQFRYEFYDVEHCFNRDMQNDIFKWLDAVLFREFSS